MHFLFPVAIVFGAAALAQPAAAPVSPGQPPGPIAGSLCPEASQHLANQVGTWRGQPLQPRKLGELPPAESFAAMVATDARGCLVPVKYPPSRR